jgi:hypothetical protein
MTLITYENAAKHYPAHRLPALEQSSADDGHLVGRDPRRMTPAELARARWKVVDGGGHDDGR